jgi:GntR family transcriptional regulator, carbon starvation induced regulator
MLQLDDIVRASGTRAGAIYDAIRQDILSCKLLPGQWLRSDTMKLEYDAGVSTIREAVSRLAAEGLVQQVDQRGARVADVSEDDLRDLLLVREHVESLALGWSVARGDEAWEAQVVSRFHMFKRSLSRGGENISDDNEIQRRHEAFHLSLIAACGSPRLTQIIQTLYAQTRRYRLMADYGRSADSEVVAEHEQIMDAALDRNAEAASQLFRKHAAKTIDLALVNLALLKERMAAAGGAT